MTFQDITTHDIRVGDLILNHGMRLRVDREPRQTSHPVDNAGGITLATRAVIENWSELVAQANDGHSTSKFIVSLVNGDRHHDIANGREPDIQPRWTIQGNGWARWAREVKA